MSDNITTPPPQQSRNYPRTAAGASSRPVGVYVGREGFINWHIDDSGTLVHRAMLTPGPLLDERIMRFISTLINGVLPQGNEEPSPSAGMVSHYRDVSQTCNNLMSAHGGRIRLWAQRRMADASRMLTRLYHSRRRERIAAEHIADVAGSEPPVYPEADRVDALDFERVLADIDEALADEHASSSDSESSVVVEGEEAAAEEPVAETQSQLNAALDAAVEQLQSAPDNGDDNNDEQLYVSTAAGGTVERPMLTTYQGRLVNTPGRGLPVRRRVVARRTSVRLAPVRPRRLVNTPEQQPAVSSVGDSPLSALVPLDARCVHMQKRHANVLTSNPHADPEHKRSRHMTLVARHTKALSLVVAGLSGVQRAATMFEDALTSVKSVCRAASRAFADEDIVMALPPIARRVLSNSSAAGALESIGNAHTGDNLSQHFKTLAVTQEQVGRYQTAISSLQRAIVRYVTVDCSLERFSFPHTEEAVAELISLFEQRTVTVTRTKEHVCFIDACEVNERPDALFQINTVCQLHDHNPKANKCRCKDKYFCRPCLLTYLARAYRIADVVHRDHMPACAHPTCPTCKAEFCFTDIIQLNVVDPPTTQHANDATAASKSAVDTVETVTDQCSSCLQSTTTTQ